MKHLRTFAIGILGVAMALLLMNCEQKSSTGPSQGQSIGSIGAITLTAEDPALYSVPGIAVTTEITATVTDTAGTAVSGILVHFTTPSFGSISSTLDTTDTDGKVTVTFNTQGQFGTAVITASVTSGGETKTGSITVGVYALTGLASDITLALSPVELFVASGADDSVKVTVSVTDSLNVGIPDMYVSISTTLGIITIPSTTNNSGMVVTYLHTNGEYGMGVVTASVNTALPEPPDTTEALPPGPGSGSMPALGKAANSRLGSGSAMGPSSKYPAPPPPPQTYDIYTLTATDTFWVKPMDQKVSQVSVDVWPSTLYRMPGEEDSVRVDVRVRDSLNIGVSGIDVNLQTTLGILAGTGQTGINGMFQTYIYTDENDGMGIVTAWVGSEPNSGGGAGNPPPNNALTWPGLSKGAITASKDGYVTNSGKENLPASLDDVTYYTDADTFWVLPVNEQVAGLSLEAYPSQITVTPDTISSSTIIARVFDANNNGVEGIAVSFATNMGTIVAGSGLTDETGSKSATYYSMQGTYGTANIWAVVGDFSDTTTVTIQQQTTVDRVTLTALDYDLFTVPGVPITTLVTATVTDAVGTAVSGVLVYFTTPTIGSISLTQNYTNDNGQAQVTFNSQNQFGLTDISAYVTTGQGTKSDTVTIGVFPLSQVPSSINAVAPPTVYMTPGQNLSFEVGAWVRDQDNVALPNIQVTFSTTLGAIEISAPTDSSGYAMSSVHNIDGYGTGKMVATVSTSSGSISDSAFFAVLPVGQQLAAISVSSSPSSVSVAPDASGNSLITATVVDANNNGIAGIPISFATNLGWLTYSSGLSDSTGSKTVTYNSSPNSYGTAQVWAYVDELTDTCTVIVSPTASSSGSIELYTNTSLIYADNGITKANLTAQLKDADNQVIQGALIIFTSNYGTVNSPAMTDSTGRAYAIFQDNGTPSLDSATVIAKYNALNVADTVKIMIAPALGVDHIQLNAGTSSITANGLDSTRVDATVYLENDFLAPTGTQVNFYIGGDDIGDFSPPVGYVTNAGTATVYYKAGITTGVDSLTAEVEATYSNTLPMVLHSGPPTQVDITVDPQSLPVNSTQSMVVTATVRDTTGNPVEDNIGVVFSTTLGSIWPPGAPTLNGQATSSLSPSTTAGSAWVKAMVGLIADSTLATFEPTGPAYVNLSAQFASITVAGSGDTNQTAIYAHIKDAANNYVGNGVMVHFQIANNGFPFGGVNINNSGIEDSSLTNGGIATVVLNAGSEPGPVQIRAWTYMVDSTEISAQQSLVTIVAGPPASIIVNPMSAPEDAGGDAWQVEVSALVRDDQGNQVPDGYSVSFYLLPNNIAQIQGAAVTGNENWAGETNPGVAYTTLTYQSHETFSTVNIYAYCMVGIDSVVGSSSYKLPIAEGSLTMSIIPIAWNYDNPPPGQAADPAVMKCTATLKDGHNNWIDNGVLSFISPKGDFWFYENGVYPSNYKITGPAGFTNEPPDSTGMAIIWLRTTFNQAFPNPDALEATAQVLCQLQEYESEVSSTPITVTFVHNIGGVLPPEPDAALKE